MRLNQDPLKKIEESIEEIERSVATRWRSALTSVTQYDEAVNVERVVKHLHDALAVMRTELECAREELGKAESRNQSLAKSQAEALVNSAEIIIELEETKRCLMESHEAEREAKIAAERLVGFGNILDASDNEIYLFDCHTLRFVHVNQGARKNIGYSMDELREMTPLHVKPEFDRDTFERTLEPLRSGRCNAVRFTTVHLRKDGTRYPVEVHLHRSEFEERVVFVAVILDSTQKEQAEDEIRKLSITVEQSPASVVIMDVNGGIEYVNPMFTQVKGISRREALASDSRKMLEDRLFGNQYDEIWQTVCAGKIWCGEVENRQNNGEPSWESVSISPIRNSREEITHFLVTFQDVTDKKKLLEQMEYMAFHDSLTGLPNRASVLRHIQKAFDERNAERSALLFLDFDRFKLINDSLGHKIGDELLRQISDRLRSNLGHLDTVVSARLGGDEFVVFLSDPPSSDFVANVADKLLQAFAESYQLFGNTVHSTVSIGIVTSQHGYQSANEMLRDADLAMYEAKAKGKGCSVVFNESMYERAEKRLKIECELRKAILRDEFVLHYQPIIALESGRLAGVETLVRWNHPE
ncbi:MAG: diguanylate cyclase, partial [Planctomycetales bacterium]|nr:diguanylate cyclase [Planctomycetales bacterium]